MSQEKESPDVEVTVEGFTISYSYEVYKNGMKHSNFVSMNFRTSRPVSVAEVESLQVAHSSTVTDAAYYDALARAVISKEDANELISQSRERHQVIVEKLRSRA